MFKKGQVYINPDGDIMMVTKITFSGFLDDNDNPVTTVHHVDEYGTKGRFYSNDEAIINNCELFKAEDTQDDR